MTDDMGQTASEQVRVLVHSDYAYMTKTDPSGSVSVTGFMHKSAQLELKLIQTEATASDLQGMLRAGYAPLAAYEVRLRTAEGVLLPAYLGRLELAFTVGSTYDAVH